MQRISGKPQNLPIYLEASIEAPAQAQLDGEYLRWRYDHKALKPLPAAKALSGFIRLSSGAPEKILAFVQTHGVLGIVPEVSFQLPLFHYREPLRVYSELAAQARAIVKTMHRLKHRGGRLAPLTAAEANALYPVEFARCYTGKAAVSEEWMYGCVLTAFSRWQQCCDLKLNTQGGAGFFPMESNLLRDTGKIEWPRFHLRYGHWIEGCEWDMEACDLVPGNGLHAPLNLSEASMLMKARLPVDESSLQQGVPRSGQRPSPLFNALAFQLMEEITLEEGSFFCSNCEDLSYGSYIRTDRDNYCQKEACQIEGRGKYDQEYGKARYAAKKAGLTYSRRKAKPAGH